jgi:hypothetical protein
MKRVTVVALLLVILSGAIWAACEGEVKCPKHDVATITFKGKQKFEGGHIWYLYHCSAGKEKDSTGKVKNGHDFWVRCDKN